MTRSRLQNRLSVLTAKMGIAARVSTYSEPSYQAASLFVDVRGRGMMVNLSILRLPIRSSAQFMGQEQLFQKTER
jgi:hypothetical protein